VSLGGKMVLVVPDTRKDMCWIVFDTTLLREESSPPRS